MKYEVNYVLVNSGLQKYNLVYKKLSSIFTAQFPLTTMVFRFAFIFISLLTFVSISIGSIFSQEPVQHTSADNAQYAKPNQCPANLKLITVPEGFVKSEAFNGYLHFTTGTSIVMTMVENVNYIRLCAGMTPDFYEKNNLTPTSEKDFTSDNGIPGKYFKSTFITSGVPHIRYMLFCGDMNHTLWLNITFPQMFEALVEPEIQAIVKSIKMKVDE